eukprot:274310_1
MSGWKLRKKQGGTEHEEDTYPLASPRVRRQPRQEEEEVTLTDETFSDHVYDELYNFNNSTECYTRGKQYAIPRHKIHKRMKICNHYNPYFNSGCEYGHKCQFFHLSESGFLRYCHLRKNHSVSALAADDFEEALQHIEDNMIKNACSLLRELVLQYPLNGCFNFWFARIHHLFPKPTAEDFNNAQFHYRKAIAISPNNASFHSYYAQFSAEWAKRLKLRVRCSEYKQAKDHFRKSLQIRRNPSVHFMFAKFLDEVENEYIDAIYHYKQALAVLTDDARLRLNYARCLHKMKEYELSKKQFETIFRSDEVRERQTNNSFLWPHFHFGKLLKEMQLYEQAKDQFEVCCDIMESYDNRYFSEIYYEYAELLSLNLKDYQNALYFINTAIEISPRRKYYNKILDYIRRTLDEDASSREKTPAAAQEQGGFNFGYECCDDDKHNELKESDTENAAQTFAFGAFGAHDAADSEEEMEENDNIGAENVFLADRFCRTEFDRFISSDRFGFEFEKYYDQFEDEKMNDIRVLLHEKEQILNEEWLQQKIGMNGKSIELWTTTVNMFNNQHARYVAWLRMNGFFHKYFKKFETYGILHLQSFFYHIKSVNDV